MDPALAEEMERLLGDLYRAYAPGFPYYLPFRQEEVGRLSELYADHAEEMEDFLISRLIAADNEWSRLKMLLGINILPAERKTAIFPQIRENIRRWITAADLNHTPMPSATDYELHDLHKQLKFQRRLREEAQRYLRDVAELTDPKFLILLVACGDGPESQEAVQKITALGDKSLAPSVLSHALYPKMAHYGSAKTPKGYFPLIEQLLADLGVDPRLRYQEMIFEPFPDTYKLTAIERLHHLDGLANLPFYHKVLLTATPRLKEWVFPILTKTGWTPASEPEKVAQAIVDEQWSREKYDAGGEVDRVLSDCNRGVLAVKRLLSSDNYQFRVKAVRMVGALQITDFLPDLRKLADEDDRVPVRKTAAKVLAQLDRGGEVEALIRNLTAETADMRRASAKLLGELGDVRAVGPLMEATKDRRSAKVRQRAVNSLARLGDKRALPALVAALSDTKAPVRAEAATALGNLGGSDEIPALAKCLGDPEERVATAAFRALKKLKAIIQAVGLAGENMHPAVYEPVYKIVCNETQKSRSAHKTEVFGIKVQLFSYILAAKFPDDFLSPRSRRAMDEGRYFPELPRFLQLIKGDPELVDYTVILQQFPAVWQNAADQLPAWLHADFRRAFEVKGKKGNPRILL